MDRLNNNKLPKANATDRSQLTGIISFISSILGLSGLVIIIILDSFGRLSTLPHYRSSLPINLLSISLVCSVIGFIFSIIKMTGSNKKNGLSIAGLVLSIVFFCTLFFWLQASIAW